MQGMRAEAWHDIERRVVKALLSAGVRRVEEAGIRPDLFSHRGAQLVWAGALRAIESGARSVWLDGGLLATITATTAPNNAREAIEWVRGAADEPEDSSVDALVRSLRDRQFCAHAYSLAAKIRVAVEEGTSEAATRAEQLIGELRDATESRQSAHRDVKLESAADAFDRYMAEAKAEVEHKRLAKFGLPTVDRWTRQVPGTMTVVGAPSTVGKSGLLASLCLATARAGHGAAFLSVEDPWSELSARIAAETAMLNPDEARSAQPSFDTSAKVQKARAELARLRGLLWGVRIEDRSIEATLTGIRQAHKRGCLVVGVDFAQAWRKPRNLGKNDTRRDWLDEGLAACLAATAERDMVLVVLSQVSRDKNRERVDFNSLRETSSLGENAGTVVTLTPKARASQDAPDRASLSIEKAKGVKGGKGRRVELVRDEAGTFVEDVGSSELPRDEWGA